MEAAITREQSRIGIRLRHQLPAEALPVGKFQAYLNRSEYRLVGDGCRRLDSGGAETATDADVSTCRHAWIRSRHSPQILRQGALLLSGKLQSGGVRGSNSLRQILVRVIAEVRKDGPCGCAGAGVPMAGSAPLRIDGIWSWNNHRPRRLPPPLRPLVSSPLGVRPRRRLLRQDRGGRPAAESQYDGLHWLPFPLSCPFYISVQLVQPPGALKN